MIPYTCGLSRTRERVPEYKVVHESSWIKCSVQGRLRYTSSALGSALGMPELLTGGSCKDGVGDITTGRKPAKTSRANFIRS